MPNRNLGSRSPFLESTMDSRQARILYHKNATAMAYVDVELRSGDRSIGSAFHIGDGVYVTARHVVENNKIVEVKATDPVSITAGEMFPSIPSGTIKEYESSLTEIMGHEPMFKHWPDALEIECGPFFPEDTRIDLAVFRASNVHPAAGVVDLGFHYDDWVYRYPWALSDAVILGYPPIPLTSSPHLVSARAEIHTFVQPWHSPHVHFILSATPRGGFSGGVALHEGGVALGVITSGLRTDNLASDLGFMAVLSVEPIHVLLKDTELTPTRQKENWKRMMQGCGRKRRSD